MSRVPRLRSLQIALFILLLLTGPLLAQVPTTFNYQGRLLQNTEDQDAVVGSIDIVFSIWSGPANDGSAVQLWSESWTGVTLSNGIFSVLLGSNGSPLEPGDFQGDTSLYLQFEVDGETLLPRQQLGSAPFAMVDEPENEFQDLALADDELSLTSSDATVDLSGYLDNTDEQTLDLSANQLTISGSDSSVDLSAYLDDKDQQTLALAANVLTISGSGSSVSLAGYLDNTDVQTLTLTGNTLSISGSGSSVDLSGTTDIADLAARIATIEEDLLRKVFVSSSAYDGDLGGVAGADALCQGLADAAGLPGAYLAWLSNDEKSPATRFGRLGVFELIDGTRVADDWSDLVDGALQNAVDVTEQNVTLGSVAVWTDTTSAGSDWTGEDCAGWGSSEAGDAGSTGSSTASDATWTQSGGLSCDQPAHLYCFEQFAYQIDDQRLTLDGTILSLSGSDSSIDLATFVDNTDSQDLSLSGTTLSLTGDATSVDLSGFLDNTDAQDLSLSGNTLSLTGDASTVSLSGYLDNTDNQVLSVNSHTLRLTSDDGTDTVSLTPYLDNTDNQVLSISGTNLRLSSDDGTDTVSLSSFLDNTDSQDLNSVLAQGSDANNRDIINLDDLDVNDIDAETFDCPNCIHTDDIDQDEIGGNDISDNIYILWIDCNGSCSDMSMRDACDVIENLRGLSTHVELIGVSCVHDVPSTTGNGFVACDDGDEVHGDNECRAFNLRTLGDIPCVNGDGTDAIVTCLETDIAK